MQTTSTVGQRIHSLRAKRKWLLADLSQRSGLAMSTLSRIETGNRTPSLGSLKRIAEALGVEVRDLIPRKAA